MAARRPPPGKPKRWTAKSATWNDALVEIDPYQTRARPEATRASVDVLDSLGFTTASPQQQAPAPSPVWQLNWQLTRADQRRQWALCQGVYMRLLREDGFVPEDIDADLELFRRKLQRSTREHDDLVAYHKEMVEQAQAYFQEHGMDNDAMRAFKKKSDEASAEVARKLAEASDPDTVRGQGIWVQRMMTGVRGLLSPTEEAAYKKELATPFKRWMKMYKAKQAENAERAEIAEAYYKAVVVRQGPTEDDADYEARKAAGFPAMEPPTLVDLETPRKARATAARGAALYRTAKRQTARRPALAAHPEVHESPLIPGGGMPVVGGHTMGSEYRHARDKLLRESIQRRRDAAAAMPKFDYAGIDEEAAAAAAAYPGTPGSEHDGGIPSPAVATPGVPRTPMMHDNSPVGAPESPWTPAESNANLMIELLLDSAARERTIDTPGTSPGYMGDDEFEEPWQRDLREMQVGLQRTKAEMGKVYIAVATAVLGYDAPADMDVSPFLWAKGLNDDTLQAVGSYMAREYRAIFEEAKAKSPRDKVTQRPLNSVLADIQFQYDETLTWPPAVLEKIRCTPETRNIYLRYASQCFALLVKSAIVGSVHVPFCPNYQSADRPGFPPGKGVQDEQGILDHAFHAVHPEVIGTSRLYYAFAIGEIIATDPSRIGEVKKEIAKHGSLEAYYASIGKTKIRAQAIADLIKAGLVPAPRKPSGGPRKTTTLTRFV